MIPAEDLTHQYIRRVSVKAVEFKRQASMKMSRDALGGIDINLGGEKKKKKDKKLD